MINTRICGIHWLGAVLILVELMLVLGGGYFALRGPIANNDLEIWYNHSDPLVDVYEREKEVFGANEKLLVLIDTTELQFDEARTLVTELENEIERVTNVERTTSIFSQKILSQTEDGFYYAENSSHTEDSQEFLRLMASHPISSNILLNGKDNEFWVIVVHELEHSDGSGEERKALVTGIQSIISNTKHYEKIKFTGPSLIGDTLDNISTREFKLFLPLTVGLSVLAVIVLTGFDVRLALPTVISTNLVAGSTIGAVFFFGQSLNLVLISLPGIVYAISIATSFHTLNWFHKNPRLSNESNRDWEKRYQSALIKPLFAAHLTTAMAFLSLSAINVIPIQAMAYFGALGILFSFIDAAWFLPNIMIRSGSADRAYNAKGVTSDFFATLEIKILGLYDLANTHKGFSEVIGLGLIALILLVGGLGVSRLSADSTYLSMLRESNQIRKDYRDFEEYKLPSSYFSIVLQSKGDQPVSSDTLQELFYLSSEFEKIDEVVRVISPHSIFQELEDALELNSRDDDSVEDAFIFASTGGSLDLYDYIDLDLSSVRIVAFTNFVENHRLNEIVNEVVDLLVKNTSLLNNYVVSVSGVPVLWANLDRAILEGQLVSILILVVTAFVVILVSFRSFKIAIIGLFANLLPILIIGAGMGWLGIKLDVATVFILSIVLGISLDDTFIFMSQFMSELKCGKSAMSASRSTLRLKYKAISLTTMVVCFGFLPMVMSSFIPVVSFGIIVTLGLIVALGFDVLCLPLLLSFTLKSNGLNMAK